MFHAVRRWRFGWQTALLAVVLSHRDAWADAEQAQRLFAEAEQAFDAEEYLRAAELFEQANHHAPHPSVLFNAAVSWDHGGELARAANDYRAALADEGLSPAQTEESEQRLAALAERLGYVQIAKPIGGLVSVAHIEREPIPARFYLNPGDYQVELETPDGRQSRTSIEVEAGQTLKVTLNEVEVRTEAPPPEQPPPPPPPPSSTQETVGWVGVSVGAVVAGLAVYFGTQALAAQDAFLKQRDDATLRQNAVDAQVRTNVAWVGAGIAGGVGTVLLFTSPTFEF